MRIISGKYRGKKLLLPNKEITRPTTDRMKENLFNVLQHKHISNWSKTRVLDCFAGSGSLGLECFSRGSQNVVFFEKNKTVASILKNNVSFIDSNGESIIYIEDILKFSFKKLEIKFNLVFLDPPYNENLIPTTIEYLLSQDITDEKCLFVIESNNPDLEITSLKLLEKKKVAESFAYILVKK